MINDTKKDKFLIISGPTATGKTSLAIKLAKKFNGELISADSRQIYREMDIGTGKDHPKNVKIHLVDIINPNESFSVAQYRNLAIKTINEIYSRGKLPVIVGGTGLYIDSIINLQPTFSIKPKPILRFFLNRFSVSFLQKIYSFLDFESFKKLNQSDINNPHRLIRKIEIKLFLNEKIISPFRLPAGASAKVGQRGTKGGFNFLHLSLTAPNQYIYQKINKRIDNRLNNGLLGEINSLLKSYKWSDPGLNTLAYKEFQPYFQKQKSLEKCVDQWRHDEHAYLRRQKTWFKKRPEINFFDITQGDYPQTLIDFVAKWYNQL
ncbi:MAG: tRNA (adenosine(37)-N6)-dimethylallyltransferase MiaA [Candidatus Shapirobacteria bacterium]